MRRSAQLALFETTQVDYETPETFFRPLAEEFGFELDVAASPENAKCSRFFTIEEDGLAQAWAPAVCWMNPPYRDAQAWTAKAVEEAKRGATVVGLLPARTDTEWFHRDVLGAGAEVRFIRGRLSFRPRRQASDGKVRDGNAAFPSILVVWRPPGA